MGNIYLIYCESLDRERNESERSTHSFPDNGHTQYEFRSGVGKLYSPEKLFEMKLWKRPFIFSLVENKEIRSEIKKALKKGYQYSDQYGHAVYGCTKCGDLYGKFYFCLSDGNKNICQPAYRCEKCSNELVKFTIVDSDPEIKLVNHRNEDVDLPCRKCGGKMKIQHIGYWD